MKWQDAKAPSLDEFDVLAREAFETLPVFFRAKCGDVLIHVADLAEDDILNELGFEDPFELTGLYEGADLTSRSLDDFSSSPAHVHLYRLAILAEWVEDGDMALGALIRHVLVHEIGHHFGLSDDDMRRIEES